eukprot:CAMPEP_0113906440 /NCGR_PEP_ID=MMETSP0780_2-20120614/24747_1 /TAXON_ID=652834 /ORGANISM="Palpitomonas bilix" /LENGTH=277 /DNA_ID=CAMNT_0000901037 /DNA_START=241 /DNA_END=1071 /DNA_ORIENTATION=+ /assembly_acc=CAM_ASM_000599
MVLGKIVGGVLPSVGMPLKGLVEGPLWRAMLSLFGIFGITSNGYALRQDKAKRDELFKGLKPAHGDIIVANSISYIDIFVLQYVFKPTFTEIVVGKKGDEPKFRAIGVFGALQNAFRTFHRSGEGAGQSLASISDAAAKRKGGPVVVFPEGTSTNGEGVLHYIQLLMTSVASSDFKRSVHICGLKYGGMSPALTAGPAAAHVVKNMMCFARKVELRVLRGHDIPQKPNTGVVGNLQPVISAWENRIQQCQASLLGVQRCEKTGDDKEDFIEYFNKNK